ncbi:MAG: ATP-binding protein [Pararhizobium sp.]
MTTERAVPPDAANDLDLVACEREPIRIPGSIQPHGILFVLDAQSLDILQASANLRERLGIAVEEVLRRPLETVFAESQPDLLADLHTRLPDQGTAILRIVTLGDCPYRALAHRSQGTVILELEEATGTETGTLDTLYPQIRAFVDDLQTMPTVDALNDLAAAQVRRITGFDRVMVYRFDERWNGTVVAEDRNDALPSYLDLRFPASDIPAQARELYRLNRLRLIPDAGYQPVPIVPAANPKTGQPTDLSFSVLRSVSPVHVEYMKNMGTPSSMSISIVEEGRLWGLISCHSSEPRRVPAHVRAACDFLAQILAMQLSAKGRGAEASQRVALQGIEAKLLAFMAAEEHFINGLAKHPDAFLALTEAGGAAVVFEGECVTVGTAPPEGRVRDIAAWLSRTQPHDEVFSTVSLAAAMPETEDLAAVASGLLAVSISQLHPSYVLWFRPEVVQTVRWGGDPRKAAAPTPGGMRLHPRKSFEMWKETVRLTSDRWTSAQVDTAQSLRNAIVGIVMRKAEELAELTEELTRSNKELESFSYSVSHDLRAPFRHIVGYAELLKEDDSVRLHDRGRRYVETIIESAVSAGRLVDDLLSFSQMGRSALMPIRIDMNRLVDEVRRMLAPEMADRQVDWHVEALHPTRGDGGMLRQVVQNLLSNALKYTRSREKAVIEIRSRQTPAETIYSVRDNGVGFDMAYVGKLFGVFQRLHRMEDFEGTGIGLANVRRIVDRHGGRAWAEGQVDKGATFYFALPNRGKG